MCSENENFAVLPQKVSITLSPEQNASVEETEAAALRAAALTQGTVRVTKRSIDARKKPVFVLQCEVYGTGEPIPEPQTGFRLQNVSQAPEVHIIGFGPAGMFAALQLIENGLKPVVLERGKAVKERRRDLAILNKEQIVNPDSNYCFGEGGAGTYSDGKLYTRSNKRGDVPKVLRAFIDNGADPVIAVNAHPHIGTNKLPGIVEAMRETIIACGGEVHFNTRVTGFDTDSGKIRRIRCANGTGYDCRAVILATGHSARDIFELLHSSNILIEAKPFALGVRIEHPQEVIDRIQYHCDSRGDYLPPSSYSLVEQVQGKGVFSFCMCPGGIIAPAATAPGEIVVNGWSPSKRNGAFANSGFVAAVDEADFKPWSASGPLSAMHFQQHWEQLAFATRGNLQAPAQRVEDFISKKASSTLPACSYIPGIASRPLDEVLPRRVSESLRAALVAIGKKMKGYRSNEAVLVGVESRTSSPVRIPRDRTTLQHPQMANLFPCGEGAGYAGGIVSAAIDGMNCALAAEQLLSSAVSI